MKRPSKISPAKRLDGIGRRSRFHRQPTGKRIVLTGRDIELFQLLWRYRFLRSDRIVAYLAPKSPKRLIERLGDLYHEVQLVNRPTAQWNEARAEQKHLAYELTNKGFDAYLDASASAPLPSPIVKYAGGSDRQVLQFHHALHISEVMIDIEIGLRRKHQRQSKADCLTNAPEEEPTKNLTMSLSKTAHLLGENDILNLISAKRSTPLTVIHFSVAIPKSHHMPFQKVVHHTKIIPDAFFGIEQDGTDQSLYRFYALEVERKNPLRRGNLDKPSTLKKLLAYQALIKSNGAETQFGLPNIFIIFAAEHEAQLLAIIELAHQIWTEREVQFILFAPPNRSHSWQTWLSEHRGQLTDTQNSLLMEIAQKWSKHFEA